MSTLPKVANFPYDNNTWIVHSYGGVVQNIHGGYLAELLMNKIVREKVSSATKIFRVPVRDLDFIRIGTIWENQTFISDTLADSDDYRYSFDFLQYSPKIVPLCKTKIYESRRYDKIDRITNEHFKNSNYLSLVTSSGTTVLIPILEVLSSIILPDNKEIREKLLLKDINTILGEYLEEYYMENSKYIIKPKVAHLDRTLIFLAYLGLNNIVQQRLSKILSSMLVTSLSSANNRPVAYKHPEILPFQPSKLTLHGKCREIDANTVMMYQVTGIVDEEDYDVLIKKIINEERNSKTDKKNKKYSYKSISKLFEEFDMLDDCNPHFGNGHVQTRSKVKRIGKQKNILIEEEKKQQREEVDREWFLGDKKTSSLSSADKDNKQESKDTTQNKLGDDKEEEQLSVFEHVLTDLSLLQENKQIDSFCYISNEGTELNTNALCRCNLDEVKDKKKKTWFRKKIGKKYYIRKFLLLKIYVKNISIYLLEIEQIKKGEKYAGILFQCNNLDEKSIQALLRQIGKNKGTYIKKEKQNKTKALPIGEYRVYFHYKNKNNVCRALQKNYGVVSCRKEPATQVNKVE